MRDEWPIMTDNINPDGSQTIPEAAEDELVRMDLHRYKEPALGIVEAVAGVTDRRPTELPPLGSNLDVDALNSLLSATGKESNVFISFEYIGLLVKVSQSGGLVIESTARHEQ